MLSTKRIKPLDSTQLARDQEWNSGEGKEGEGQKNNKKGRDRVREVGGVTPSWRFRGETRETLNL